MLFTLVTALVLVSGAEAPTLEEAPAAREGQSIAAKPCRPTIACTAELVPEGSFEVEFGYGASQSSTLAHSGSMLLKYSVLSRLQVQLATSGLFVAGPGLAPRAFDGVTPGLKWWAVSQGSFLPSLSLAAYLTLPTHALPGARQQTLDLQTVFFASKDVGVLHFDLNVFLNVFDLAGAPTPQGQASLVTVLSLPRRFSLFTDVYSAFGNAQARPLDGGSLSGVSFSPVDELVFDAGVDVGFYPQTRAFTFFAGVTFVPHRRAGAPIARRVQLGAPLAVRD